VVALAAAARPVTRADRDQARAAAVAMQRQVLEHCDRTGDRMALLDSVPGDGRDGVLEQRGRLAGTNGALYFPWLVADGGARVPPCGHVAGVYARGDAAVGVHKAPANERLQGVQDVEVLVDDAVQRDLHPAGINCIRAFRGRGVRVWGARTLSPDPAWTHVGVRRVFLTLRRWIALNLPGVAFEPNQPLLWARIGREVRAYLEELYRRGALRGRSPAEAFYVRCDASTNPPEARDAGLVVTEIGLAPAVPGEFVVVRYTHGPGGVELAGPGPTT
jgi:phage tail sheath protein FI